MLQKYIKCIEYCFLCLAVLFSLCFSNNAYASETDDGDSSSNQTALSQYALSWAGHSEMPYIYGGPGGRTGPFTIEECSEQGVGYDCSAFTAMVYGHFGIKITAYTESQLAEAKAVYHSEEDAIPGDIMYWPGHVGIYIGDGKMVHTSHPDPPDNFPHVKDIYYRGSVTFLRMVDDPSQLGELSNTDSDKVQDDVESSPVSDVVLTISEITGEYYEDTIVKQQQLLSNARYEDLSLDEKAMLAMINEDLMYRDEVRSYDLFGVLQSLLGLLMIVYGVLMSIAYLFDYSNNFIDISLLSIISLGRFRIVSESAVNKETFKLMSRKGKNRGICYLSVSGLLIRVFLLFIVGFMLLSHLLGNAVYSVVRLVLGLI